MMVVPLWQVLNFCQVEVKTQVLEKLLTPVIGKESPLIKNKNQTPSEAPTSHSWLCRTESQYRDS